jgi:hypothetical protein
VTEKTTLMDEPSDTEALIRVDSVPSLNPSEAMKRIHEIIEMSMRPENLEKTIEKFKNDTVEQFLLRLMEEEKKRFEQRTLDMIAIFQSQALQVRKAIEQK